MTEGKNVEGRKSLLDVFSVYRRRLRWDFRGCCLIFIVIVTLPVYQQGLSTNILFCKNVTKIQKYAFLLRMQKITIFCENFLSQLYVFINIWAYNFVKIFICTVCIYFTVPEYPAPLLGLDKRNQWGSYKVFCCCCCKFLRIRIRVSKMRRRAELA